MHGGPAPPGLETAVGARLCRWKQVPGSLWELQRLLLLLLLRFRDADVNNGLSLKSLAADLLNVGLDKRVELRCSDWEAEPLTLEQVRPGPAL